MIAEKFLTRYSISSEVSLLTDDPLKMHRVRADLRYYDVCRKTSDASNSTSLQSPSLHSTSSGIVSEKRRGTGHHHREGPAEVHKHARVHWKHP